MMTLPTPKLPFLDSFASDSVTQPFEQMFDFKTFASLRRMVSHQQSKPLLRRADFLKQITLYLPEVAARIEESDFGVLHLEVGASEIGHKRRHSQPRFRQCAQTPGADSRILRTSRCRAIRRDPDFVSGRIIFGGNLILLRGSAQIAFACNGKCIEAVGTAS